MAAYPIARTAMYHGLEDELSQTITVEVKVDVPDSADARWCIEQYYLELAERFDTGFDPIKSNPAPDEDLVPPRGYFVVARLDGHPVGCGVLKRKNPTTGEIKRMWTASYARRRGVARKVLHTLETLAREAGLTVLHLETNRTLAEAQALYRKEGYIEVDAFNEEPYAHHWFEKHLQSDSGQMIARPPRNGVANDKT
jgi:GNAT superfamily N-acetyltransferase